MLEIRGVRKRFQVAGKTIPILDISEWNVNQGEQIAITGPSGSGKSTLLHLISGIMKPDSGVITIGGERLSEMNEASRDTYRSAHIGYIMQDFYLIPSLTARENIQMALSGSRKGKSRQANIAEWLERVGLKDRGHHKPAQLSRGQQQRVAIVRALIHEPELVLADEPTGSLDWETADEIGNLLLELCDSQRQTLLVVTHDLNMAERFPVSKHIHEINLMNRNMQVQGDIAI
ncbi:ABC transporter ATP-binding protein [Paenibacillus sp. A14]|uniref:ABC transporter ATP-binding protein n=1 Tax=Paenibacillus sp. A14 TaxID=3119820 RepID=UPI002FE385EE